MTDEELFQTMIGRAVLARDELRETLPRGHPDLVEVERMIAHCEWRHSNQDRPHPNSEGRT